MPDSITQELSSAYAQLAKLQTKLDEDDYIISAITTQTQNLNTHADIHRCDDRHGESCDAALEIIAARRKELDKDLRKVKKQIAEIEEKWKFWAR